MKITPKVLSIPPYISTSWKNIASLHVEQTQGTLLLIVTLLSGVRIEVPHLQPAFLESIFSAHTQSMELEEKTSPTRHIPRTPLNLPAGGQEQIFSLELPLNGIFPGIENLGALLQHNQTQADTPDLPEEVISRITQLAQVIGVDDVNAIPKPEPHCNCMYCQTARALQKGMTGNTETPPENQVLEEIVTNDDLKFRSWEISQTADKLFLVTNPLDSQEHYNVYLGEPIGCTCGEKHCEHIQAVLNS